MFLMMLACAGTQGDPTFGSSGDDDTGPLPTATEGQTYYVSPDGDDSHSGSAERPLRTLQAAADMARPGDTWVALAGTYTSFEITTGGNAEGPITFAAESAGSAIIDGGGNVDYGVVVGDVSQVVIQCFEIRDFRWTGVLVNGQDVVVAYNDIHTIGDRGESSGQSILGVLETDTGRRNQYLGNAIHDVGRSQSSPEEFHRLDQGIWIGGNEATVANNLFADNDTGWAVYVTSVQGVEKLTVTNNTFIEGARHLKLQGALDTIWVQNNVFYDPQDSYESVNFDVDEETLSDVTVRYNIGWPIGVADACTICTVEDNLDGEDPGLADVAARSPYLSAASVAIDAGVRDRSPETDIDGDARPAGRTVDIGAHEVQ